MSTPAPPPPPPQRARVWDAPVRVVHWALAAAFGLAWVTAGEPRWLDVHLYAGWAVAGLLAVRAAWAVVGTRYARWRASWYAPREVVAYARRMVAGTAERHLGHTPVASWAMFGVVGLLAALTLTGVLVQGGEEQHGPLAGWLTVAQGVALHEVHEWVAWAVLAWLALHLAGVAKESLRTRENLVVSMVDGRKRGADASVRAYRGVAGGIVGGLAVAGLAWFGPAWTAPADPPYVRWARELPTDATWTRECGDCHLAFHPSLLPARSWEAMLAGQAEHFGEDLFLEPATVAELRAFAVAHAAEAGESESAVRIAATVPPGEAPQRITELAWWRRVHADLGDEVYTRDEVGGRVRCAACHADAASGAFEDGAMNVPGGSRGTTREAGT